MWEWRLNVLSFILQPQQPINNTCNIYVIMVSVKNNYSITIDADEMQAFDTSRGKVPRSPAIEGLIRLANRDGDILARALACEPDNERAIRGVE